MSERLCVVMPVYVLSLLLSGGIACAYVYFADYLHLPWCDELCFADTAVNLALDRGWGSHVWPYSYNLLHVHLLWGWLKCFGISHRTVCALDVVLAWCSFAVLACAAYRTRICRHALSFLMLAVCFWFVPVLFNTINGGRVDTLVMLFTILSVWSIARFGDCDNRKKAYVFLSTFFLMLSAVYSVPVVAALCAFQVAGSFRDRRALRREISIALTAAMGVLLAYLLCCVFYFCHGSLLRFVNSYFSYGVGSLLKGASPLSRVVGNYLHDGIPLLCLVGGAGLGVAVLKIRLRRRLLCLLLWAVCIPLVMTLAGRYERYYRWLFILPAMLVGVGVLERLNRKAVQGLVLGVAMAYSAVILAGLIKARRLEFDSIHRLPRDIKGSHVVLADDRLYYHVVGSGNTLWKIRDRNRDLSPREKIERAVNSLNLGEKTKDRMRRAVKRIERLDESLPGEGYAVGIDAAPFNDNISNLRRLGYATEVQTNGTPLLRARFFRRQPEPMSDGDEP